MRPALIALALLAASPASAHCFAKWDFPSDNWHGHHRCDGGSPGRARVETARVAAREVKPPPAPPPIAREVDAPPKAIQGGPTDADPDRAMAIEALKLKLEAPPSAVRCK